MPKNLLSEEDVQSTIDSMGGSTSKVFKFDENKHTPVFLMCSRYQSGHVHYVELPGGGCQRIVCASEKFDPTSCKLDGICLENYREAKRLESDGDPVAGKRLRDATNKMRRVFAAEFIAVKGEMITTKDSKTGKKTEVADFEDGEVGILSLSEAQFQDFTGLVNSAEYPYMKSFADLFNRAIIVDKRKREKAGKKALYPTTKFIPSANTSPKPKIEYNEDEFNLDSDFEVDLEKIESVMTLLQDTVLGGEADLEYENMDTSDVGGGEPDVEEETEDTINDLSDTIEEETETDDDFVDDIPFVEPTPKKKTSTPVSKSTSKPVVKDKPVAKPVVKSTVKNPAPKATTYAKGKKGK
jgi:hypothetical protein